MIYRLRSIPRAASQVIVAVALLAFSLSGQCASETGGVATKVADLSDPYVIVYGLDFSPDASRLAVQSGGEKINIWDWRHSRVEITVEKPHGAEGQTLTNPILFSPDGRLLVACDSRALGNVVIRVWNTGNWSLAEDIADDGPGGCDAAAFTPDGKLLIRAVDRTVRPSEMIAYAVGSWVPEWRLKSELAAESLAISPDGRLIALAGVLTFVPQGRDPTRIDQLVHERTIEVMTLQDRTIVRTIKSAAMGPLAWSPDGTRIALAGDFVEAYVALSGQRVMHEKPENSSHMHVRYTPDGRYFIESDINGRRTGFGVNIWDGQRQKLLQHIPGDTANISVSRDGRYLALGCIYHTTVWELK